MKPNIQEQNFEETFAPVNSGFFLQWMKGLLKPNGKPSQGIDALVASIQSMESDFIGHFEFQNSKCSIVRVVVPRGKLILLTPQRGIMLIKKAKLTQLLEPGQSAFLCGPNEFELLQSAKPYEYIITSVVDNGIFKMAEQGVLGLRPGESKLILNDDIITSTWHRKGILNEEGNSNTVMKRNALLTILLVSVARSGDESEFFAPKVSHVNRPIFDILEKVWRVPEQEWSLSYLGNITGYSPFHVCRVFRNEFSLGFKDYVTECRARRAIQLIGGTDLSLTEICESLRCADTSILRNWIKTTTGLLPSEILEFARKPRNF